VKRAIGIAGAGRIGQALGRVLYEAGLPVVAVASRNLDHAAQAAEFMGGGIRPLGYTELPGWCSRIIIAVPDDAIRDVAALLCASGFGEGLALHTSGLYGPEILDCLAAEGASCAALHPLRTAPTPEKGVVALRGSVFAISGDGEAADWAREIVQVLDGRPVEISGDARRLYHAAAVMSCNYVVVLLDAGLSILAAVEADGDALRGAFRELAHAAVDNAFAETEALTGPMARGDVETIREHLAALARAGLVDIERLYKDVARFGVQVALRQGLDESRAGQIDALLDAPAGRRRP
jgi:predicted short-subunit dehydrogenase-like oxidoreductase (DUF2520 family)